MIWSEIQAVYPNQWLIIEALETHTIEQLRYLDKLAVIETCKDGLTAMQRYRELSQEYRLREFYFVHTSRKNIEIKERQWHGIRRNHAITAQR
ncbi:MAG: hypothetical protein JEZ06_06315 [Anaerolineaceae bacterium]|nr:hypothetical protein [Anaerolineaceae bacterium]